MNVLILDGSCPKPYDAATLRGEGLGGSEASVVRVAERLGAYVCQHNRSQSAGRYLRLADALALRFDAVLSFRSAAGVAMATRSWPRARHFLWLQDLVVPKLAERAALLRDTATTVVCVSDSHVAHIRAQLEAVWPQPSITRIYNAIDDELGPDGTAFDRDKLIFFSAPIKGLEQTLQLFERLHAAAPAMRLYLANPGYLADAKTDVAGVVRLGALPHHVVIDHVRQSLCVFYPNTVFPETFGLVYAEANAVGTPVLAHDFGAAREVLGSEEQVMDARDGDRFIERVLAWRDGGRPRVAANPAFRLSTLVQEWRALLASPRTTG